MLDNILEKEFNKWYLKYSKKYEGTQFYYQVKNKLLSKGFPSDKIEKIWIAKK